MAGKQLSEEEIAIESHQIKAALANPSAFEPIYKRHFSSVYHYIKAATNQKEIAADLCADVFYAALVNLSKYRPNSAGIRPWLFGIALNQLRMYFRRSGKVMYVPIEDQNLLEFTTADQLLDAKEIRKFIAQQLSNLSEEEQELIQLRFVANCSFHEIAIIQRSSEEACKMRLYRLLNRMRKTFIQP